MGQERGGAWPSAGFALLASLGAASAAQAATFKQCPEAKFLQCARVA